SSSTTPTTSSGDAHSKRHSASPGPRQADEEDGVRSRAQLAVTPSLRSTPDRHGGRPVRSLLRQLALGATAIVLGGATLGPPSGTVGAANSGIAFGVPTVVDPIHTNGEPDIGIDVQGRVFVSGPTGTGTQRSTWFGSVDGGQTFRVMAQKTPPTAVMGIPAPGPGGGDTDINFDRSGKQYFADLYALLCLRVAVTGPVNSGATDQEGLLGCGPTSPGADRQWLAVYDPAPG